MLFQSAPPAADIATTLASSHLGRTVKLKMEFNQLTVLDPAHGPEPVVITGGDESERDDCRAVVGNVDCEDGIANCQFFSQRRRSNHYTGAGTLGRVAELRHIAYVVSPKLEYPITVVLFAAFGTVDVGYGKDQYSLSSGCTIGCGAFKVVRDGDDVTVTIL